MSCFRCIVIALSVFGLGITFSASCSYALPFDVILQPGLLGQEALYGLSLESGETSQDQAFILNRDTGEIAFGDGLRGSIPPSGAGGTAAAYRYGSESGGGFLNPFPISLDAIPVFIPLDDPSTNEAETGISFFLSGINSLRLRVVENGVWITAITPVPEPATMFLLASGLLGLAGLRRKFRKA
jgi:hypothetical protein